MLFMLFMLIKTSEKKKVACLTFCAFYTFCMCKIVFAKKIKKSKITPDNFIYYTTKISSDSKTHNSQALWIEKIIKHYEA